MAGAVVPAGCERVVDAVVASAGGRVDAAVVVMVLEGALAGEDDDPVVGSAVAVGSVAGAGLATG